MVGSDRRLFLLEDPIERRDEILSLLIERYLESWAARGELVENGIGRGKRQRILVVGAREERCGADRPRIIAVAPGAAVDPGEQVSPPGDDADRQAATQQLAVCGHVRRDSEPALRSLRMGPEAGDDFIEDQWNVAFGGQLAQGAQEGRRLKRRIAALHRLDKNGRQLLRDTADGLERSVIAVGKKQQFADRTAANTRRERNRRSISVTHRSSQRAIEVTMI